MNIGIFMAGDVAATVFIGIPELETPEESQRPNIFVLTQKMRGRLLHV